MTDERPSPFIEHMPDELRRGDKVPFEETDQEAALRSLIEALCQEPLSMENELELWATEDTPEQFVDDIQST